MPISLLRMLIFGLAICITSALGCGEYPPIVDTKYDITSLPVTEDSILARGLDDADIPSLAHLRDLVVLDFYGGWKTKNAKLTDDGLAKLATSYAMGPACVTHAGYPEISTTSAMANVIRDLIRSCRNTFDTDQCFWLAGVRSRQKKIFSFC